MLQLISARFFHAFALIVLVTSSAHAQVDKTLLAHLNQPLESLLPSCTESTLIRETLYRHWGTHNPTLKEVLQLPRSTLYALGRTRQRSGAREPWLFESGLQFEISSEKSYLQALLAEKGLSLEMTDHDLRRAASHPGSLVYQKLATVPMSRRLSEVLFSFGMLTVFDLFKILPTTERMKDFAQKILSEPNCGPKTSAELKQIYQKLATLRAQETTPTPDNWLDLQLERFPDLRPIFKDQSITRISHLMHFADEGLWELSGRNVRIVAQIYTIMNEAGIYDSPERGACNKVLQL